MKKSAIAKPTPARKPAPSKEKTTSGAKDKSSGTKRTQVSPKNTKPGLRGKSFSLQTFNETTFLTTYGVEKWLIEGHLSGGVDKAGNRYVDTANLNNPFVKRLLR